MHQRAKKIRPFINSIIFLPLSHLMIVIIFYTCMYYIKLTNWLHNKAQRTLCLNNWGTENQERNRKDGYELIYAY